MKIKGALIAAMAAGYFAAAVPAVHAADGDKEKHAKGEKAGCKGKGGCKGKDEKKEEKKEEKK
jgi:hypothetical protein